MTMRQVGRQMPAQAGRFGVGRGEAAPHPGSDEACRPRHEATDTGPGLLQVLQPLLDATFSEHSHGFRPGRSAHGAVLAAQSYVQSGQRIVVDVDLEKVFDRVSHDILIDRLRKRIPGGVAGADPHGSPLCRFHDYGARR